MGTKQSGRIALSGVLSAMAVVFLLFTYFPTASIALAAIAALCGIPVVVELGHKAGLLHYAAVSVLAAIFALTAEGTGLYIAFFGWYTVFKSFIEGKHLSRPVEWVAKVGVFAVSIAAYAAVWIWLLRMPLPAEFALWMVPVAAVVLCAVFVVYDIGMTRVIGVYHFKLRPKLRDLFRF